MLSEKQLIDAARCNEFTLSCSKCLNAETLSMVSCTEEAAKTALIYMKALEHAMMELAGICAEGNGKTTCIEVDSEVSALARKEMNAIETLLKEK